MDGTGLSPHPQGAKREDWTKSVADLSSGMINPGSNVKGKQHVLMENIKIHYPKKGVAFLALKEVDIGVEWSFHENTPKDYYY